jgi:ribosomal protein S18 acetylase RimI-like enzyme
MSLSIRPVLKEEARLIARISHQTFYDTFASDNRPEDMRKFLTEQFTLGKLILEVSDPANTFFVAEEHSSIAGYAKLRDGRVPEAIRNFSCLEIARLYALAPYIGKGVGSILMQHCINYARQKDKEFVWLGVWEKNQRAIEFYHRWGFQKFDETDFLLGDDIQNDWLMWRKTGGL